MPPPLSRLVLALCVACALGLETYYEALGATRATPSRKLRKLYRKASLRAHPDKAPAGTSKEEAEAAFIRATLASVLDPLAA